MIIRSKFNIIVTHRLYLGAGQDLYRYFKSISQPVLLVEHGFLSFPDRRTCFTEFNADKESVAQGLNYKFLPDIACHIKDFFYTLLVPLRFRRRFRVYFGCGGFNALVGIILKSVGLVEKVVFYTIDFVPNRFPNRFLNRIYMFIDRFCVFYADRTWNLNLRMVIGREKYNNMPAAKFNRQSLVPIGIWRDDLLQVRLNIVKEKKLVFCGDLTELQGLQLVLEAIPEIVRKIPGFKFTIIGSGSFKEVLQNLVRALNIAEYVEFFGPIYEPKVLFEVLSQARVGIACYKETPGASVYFADVTKPKTYLSCGLPVIITKSPAISIEILKRKMGIVIDYRKEELVDAVLKIMSDDGFYLSCKHNAEKFMLDLDWNKIFATAIEEIRNG